MLSFFLLSSPFFLSSFRKEGKKGKKRTEDPFFLFFLRPLSILRKRNMAFFPSFPVPFSSPMLRKEGRRRIERNSSSFPSPLQFKSGRKKGCEPSPPLFFFSLLFEFLFFPSPPSFPHFASLRITACIPPFLSPFEFFKEKRTAHPSSSFFVSPLTRWYAASNLFFFPSSLASS